VWEIAKLKGEVHAPCEIVCMAMVEFRNFGDNTNCHQRRSVWCPKVTPIGPRACSSEHSRLKKVFNNRNCLCGRDYAKPRHKTTYLVTFPCNLRFVGNPPIWDCRSAHFQRFVLHFCGYYLFQLLLFFSYSRAV